MTVGMAAAVQNRLFWCTGAGQASERWSLCGTETRHLGMGRDVRTEYRLQGFMPLRCCGQGDLDQGNIAESAEAANVWSEPT